MHGDPPSHHKTRLPKLFSAFFTQAALNGVIFVEIANFGCCGVLIPPGKNIGNPWTLLSAGLLTAL